MPPRIPNLRSPVSIQSPPSTLLLTACRAFSTTTPLAGKSSKLKLTKLLAKAPPYPYPIKPTFKQSWFGLYAAKHIQFGNNIPEEKYIITRRRWLPNIKHKKLWSFGLGEWVKCKLATNVLRTIDKVGGLDNYLLSEKPARLKELGPWGWELRHRLQCSKAIQRRYQEERVAMGLITREEMWIQNDQMGISRGAHEVERDYKKQPRKAATRVREFAERWKRSARVKKVLFGEPWRARAYVKKMTKSEWKMKLAAETKRRERAEAVMARQKAANKWRKEMIKEEKRRMEEIKMQRLTRLATKRAELAGEEDIGVESGDLKADQPLDQDQSSGTVPQDGNKPTQL
ncbi:54S ribosomal protein L24 [Drechslerella dactyloides]|uniref:Large ribosomal subunit protein bL28m n=1 Tax=Drechslerella dactyloides TaxID=74499 RepID=A0AAD6NJB3_DREDA|nr:54S ribosomal protein L24 [Drechslerella dactyloides]